MTTEITVTCVYFKTLDNLLLIHRSKQVSEHTCRNTHKYICSDLNDHPQRCWQLCIIYYYVICWIFSPTCVYYVNTLNFHSLLVVFPVMTSLFAETQTKSWQMLLSSHFQKYSLIPGWILSTAKQPLKCLLALATLYKTILVFFFFFHSAMWLTFTIHYSINMLEMSARFYRANETKLASLCLMW